jgi:mRNA-degrading endonuclease YafQ of YafQ-DinJ toxin-antitoxin module
MNDLTSIQVTKEFKKMIKSKRMNKESYEETLKRLISK